MFHLTTDQLDRACSAAFM